MNEYVWVVKREHPKRDGSIRYSSEQWWGSCVNGWTDVRTKAHEFTKRDLGKMARDALAALALAEGDEFKIKLKRRRVRG